MNKYFAPALVVLLAVGYGAQCYLRGKDSAEAKAAREAHQKTTDSLSGLLRGVQAKRDTLRDTVKVERVRIVRAAGRVDTVRAGFQRDTTTADSLSTALEVIVAQDTLIREQASHITTLNAVIEQDSVAKLIFGRQRVVDSTRIRQLEKKAEGWKLLGITLPRVKCGPGIVVVAYPRQAVGVGASCALAF